MPVGRMVISGQDEGYEGRQFTMAELGKVDLWSGPGRQEKMQRVLTTHLHVTLVSSQLENSDTHTH